jgi:hypothetical protein
MASTPVIEAFDKRDLDRLSRLNKDGYPHWQHSRLSERVSGWNGELGM